jgi:hypothetical protein
VSPPPGAPAARLGGLANTGAEWRAKVTRRRSEN